MQGGVNDEKFIAVIEQHQNNIMENNPTTSPEHAVINNHHPDLSPRSAFCMNKKAEECFLSELMMLLNTHKVKTLKQGFFESDGKTPRLLNLHQFIRIFIDTLPGFFKDTGIHDLSPSAGYISINEYAYQLGELFEDIDTNGDKCVDWNEFASYLIDKATQQETSSGISNKLKYEEMIISSSSSTNDHQNFHRNPLLQLSYIPLNDTLVALEHCSPTVSFYNATTGAAKGRRLQTHGRVPLSMEYIPSRQHLVLSCADKCMLGINLKLNYNTEDGEADDVNDFSKCSSIVHTWYTSQVQMSLRWVQKHQVLYTGAVSGSIHGWKLEKNSNTYVDHGGHLQGHRDSVTCMYNMDSLDNLVTGSLDSVISIWDMFTGEKRQDLRGHKHGIINIAYSPSQRLLVSASTERDALVWSPFVPTILHTLAGHKHPLTGVKSIPGTDQLVTADCSGIVKIWDVRTFGCIQTFRSATCGSELTTLEAYVNHYDNKEEDGEPHVVTATKQLYYYKKQPESKEPVTSALPVRFVIFNSVFFSILTVSGATVRLWDAVKGTPERCFKRLMPSDITAISLDERKRRFYLGDSSGNIKVFVYRTGAYLKTFTAHLTEISKIIYCPANKAILVSSVREQIIVHNDLTNDHERTVMRRMDPTRAHTDKVSATDCDDAEVLISTGGSSGSLKFWEFDTGKMHTSLHLGVPVSHLVSLSPYKAVIVATEDGFLHFVSVRGSPYSFQILFSMPMNATADPSQHKRSIAPVQFQDPLNNMYGPGPMIRDFAPYQKKKSSSSSSSVSAPSVVTMADAPVSSMKFEPTLCRLWTGTEAGVIHCWDFKEALKVLQMRGGNSRNRASAVLSVSVVFKQESSSSSSRLSSIVTAQLPNVSNLKVKHVWCRQVHSLGITSIALFSRLSTGILTASYDRTVSGWSLDGKRIGTLLKDPKNHDWEIPFDAKSFAAERSQQSRKLLAAAKDTSANLSINIEEYMSASAPRSDKQDVGMRRSHTEALVLANSTRNLTRVAPKFHEHLQEATESTVVRKVSSPKLVSKHSGRDFGMMSSNNDNTDDSTALLRRSSSSSSNTNRRRSSVRKDSLVDKMPVLRHSSSISPMTEEVTKVVPPSVLLGTRRNKMSRHASTVALSSHQRAVGVIFPDAKKVDDMLEIARREKLQARQDAIDSKRSTFQKIGVQKSANKLAKALEATEEDGGSSSKFYQNIAKGIVHTKFERRHKS